MFSTNSVYELPECTVIQRPLKQDSCLVLIPWPMVAMQLTLTMQTQIFIIPACEGGCLEESPWVIYIKVRSAHQFCS
jgi:hypothetical protein